MTNPEFNQAQTPQKILRLLNLFESLFGNFQTITDSRRKTGRCRDISRRQIHFPAQLANILFGHLGFHQGTANAEDISRSIARPKIVPVVEITSADNIVKALLPCHSGKDFIKMRFAVETAVGFVGSVGRVAQIIRLDGPGLDADILCCLESCFVLSLRQSRPGSDTGQNILSS